VIPNPLDDCMARWNRAGEHVDSLNAACQAIIKSNGYRFEPECDANGFGEIKFIDGVDPKLLSDAAIYFGEVVGNLWAARNYVIWKVACVCENTDTPSGWKGLGFPVVRTEPQRAETFWGRTKVKLQGLTQDDVDKIEAVQPYQTGDPDPTTGLRQLDPRSPHHILEELAILDRHRRLAVTGLFPVATDPDVVITKGVGKILSVTPDNSKIGQALNSGDVVARFRVRFVTNCDLETSPRAQVQIFPRDMLIPDAGRTFDVWIRGLQTCVLDLMNAFTAEFGGQTVTWTQSTRWWPI
jgi:hypothetical protein